jgi:hypothetical protein
MAHTATAHNDGSVINVAALSRGALLPTDIFENKHGSSNGWSRDIQCANSNTSVDIENQSSIRSSTSGSPILHTMPKEIIPLIPILSSMALFSITAKALLRSLMQLPTPSLKEHSESQKTRDPSSSHFSMRSGNEGLLPAASLLTAISTLLVPSESCGPTLLFSVALPISNDKALCGAVDIQNVTRPKNCALYFCASLISTPYNNVITSLIWSMHGNNATDRNCSTLQSVARSSVISSEPEACCSKHSLTCSTTLMTRRFQKQPMASKVTSLDSSTAIASIEDLLVPSSIITSSGSSCYALDDHF